MARSYDEKGGIGVYTRNIIRELLRVDGGNDYFIYYRNPSLLGSHGGAVNATERCLPSGSRLWWDQVAVPRAAKRDGIDLIFNPKFSIPLFTRIKRVMVVHGAGWFLPGYSDAFPKGQILYARLAMPAYFRACAKVLSVSKFCTNGFREILPRYKDRLMTMYFGPHAAFEPIDDPEKLEDVRRRYNLPEKFVLTVIRYDPGTPNTRKNAGNMLKAFARLKNEDAVPHKFVMVGKHCERYGVEHRIDELGIADDVIFPGFVKQEDLPSFYNLASLYLYSTLLEAFPVPITEAMSCGTPIVTSLGTGLEELAGDAALKVDPRDPAAIAAAAYRVLTDPELAADLRSRGLERAKLFNWEVCARQTLRVFEAIVNPPEANAPTDTGDPAAYEGGASSR